MVLCQHEGLMMTIGSNYMSTSHILLGGYVKIFDISIPYDMVY